MKSATIFLFVLLSCLYVIECKDLIVGSSFNNRLIKQEKVEYNAIPLKKRVKEYFFSDPSQAIKGIIARDLDHTDNQVSITSGGIGFQYVNLRFKSERGSGLNYQVEIYT